MAVFLKYKDSEGSRWTHARWEPASLPHLHRKEMRYLAFLTPTTPFCSVALSTLWA